METNKIICADSLDYMKTLPDNCIDLVLTDPPYFGIVNNEWDNQWETKQEFINWLELYTKEWKRILKDNGSLYIFGDDKIIAYVQVMMDNYFKLENSIVWYKPDNTVQKGWSGFRMYAPMTERLLFYSNEIVNIEGLCVYKSRDFIRNEIINKKGKIIFKEINGILGVATNGGGVASACLSLDKTIPAMITEEHYIKIMQWLYPEKEYEELRKEYEELRRPFNPAENYGDVWNMVKTQKKEFVGHPTQKPKELIKRIIETSSKPGDIVLDCFAGSGTTAVAAIETNRNYIVIEKEPKYCEIAEKRVKNTTPPLFTL